jgi:hypothetical protein
VPEIVGSEVFDGGTAAARASAEPLSTAAIAARAPRKRTAPVSRYVARIDRACLSLSRPRIG